MAKHILCYGNSIFLASLAAQLESRADGRNSDSALSSKVYLARSLDDVVSCLE